MIIVRLDQKTKHANWEMYEYQKYALHESIVILFHFDSTCGYKSEIHWTDKS